MGKYTGNTWFPSNGTEGMFFIDEFCSQCIHEKFMHTQDDDDKKCEIFDKSILEGPCEIPEWVYDEDDQPTCTAFRKWDWGSDDDPDGLNEPPEPDNPLQMKLPFILEEIKNSEEESIDVEQRKELVTSNTDR